MGRLGRRLRALRGGSMSPMIESRRLWLIGLLPLIFGCTRNIADDEASTSKSIDPGDASTSTGDIGYSETGPSHESGSSSTTAAPIVCEEGYTACEGECTLLGGDPGNCGECGHACKGWGTTNRCSDWTCDPAIWPCIKPDQGIETCSQACASVGQTCATEAFCPDYVRVWLTTSANDNDPEATVETCERLVDGSTSFMQGCNDPIDWDYEILGRTVLGVACCCTQD